MNTIAIIGLGKFGFYVAKRLSKLDAKVIAIDNNEKIVQEISQYTDYSYVLDSTNKEALENAGIYNLDTVIVSIGESIEANILTVMALKELGNKNIIAKAISTTHGKILTKIGATKVIHPEKIAGKMLVKIIVEDINFDSIDLSNSMRILKFVAPKSLISKSFNDIEKANFDVKLIAYKHDGEWNKDINYEHIIQEGDILAYLGNADIVEEFYENISLTG
ncbi:potassium transporter KtrAB, KtrA subunit [Campylobacter blaseri]|uniref:Potassium transporter TrkA n=1 Tax=Campylobacter blaseri TaxID=2042961 RepID=A0A2P8R0R1_9BACT|nr:TrkA family potassium uptake protein [Campylobacter blaseri]PSM52079.1 potassium transporter TrkA [Campylobacter blaseri]PSM53864.1 potassium transporter TrkA [Campylobacter blaseri]QKF85580.1 potassium transporter KtrAB, KtrA subunit [Campylobacter blaseri]